MRIVQRRVTRLTVVAACLVALAACGRGSGVPASTEQVRSAGNVTLKQVCSASLCAGSRAGAAFKIETPAKGAWNGTLLIWSHGYRAAGPIPSDPLNPKATVEQPETTAEDAPADEVAQTLLSQGYAHRRLGLQDQWLGGPGRRRGGQGPLLLLRIHLRDAQAGLRLGRLARRA